MRRLWIGALLAMLIAGCGAETTPTSPLPTETLPPTATTSTAAPTAASTEAPTASEPPAATSTVDPRIGQAAASLPKFEMLGPGWNRLYPGDPTICAHGTDYSFWARQGASDKLLIYFQPGGGCWSAETCASGSGIYDESVSDEDHPNGQPGIFDLTNPENPFADYDMVYVPVCTGDVHWGSYTQTYTAADGAPLMIHHQGFTNASTVLAWVYENITQPESIFVTGCSAGSPGSILHTPYVIEQYPDVPVAQLGDSLAFVYHRPLNMQTDYGAQQNFPQWIPEAASIAADEFTMAGLYRAIANYYPNHRFGQVNAQQDSVQIFFYEAVGGNWAEWLDDFEAGLAEIHASAPNFYSFTLGGSQHCILPRSTFYTMGVDGVSFRDWLAAYAAGDPVESMHCSECADAEYVR